MKNREKGEKRMQKFLRRLERFSQSLLSPLSYLSAAGLLLVLGALLTSKPLCQALPVLHSGLRCSWWVSCSITG